MPHQPELGSRGRLALRPLVDADVALLETWLSAPHVARYYEDPNEWLAEVHQRKGAYSFIQHRIAVQVFENDRGAGAESRTAVGFGQFYDCYAARALEDWYSITEPGVVFSIDYLIGDVAFLRQGFGAELVRALLDEVRQTTSARRVIVQPDSDNPASIGALQANGFTFERTRGYYQLEL